MDRLLYDQFYRMETTHWWFVARRGIVLDQIARRCPPGNDRSVLDIGCGTGIMLESLKIFGSVQGLDSSEDAVRYCKLRYGSGLQVQLAGLDEEPCVPQESFDIVTMLDVIEHLDDDVGGLRWAWHVAKEAGLLVCTVPAYRFLWTGHDVLNDHKRRYTMAELRRKIMAAGFAVEKITYFNTLLAPVVFLARLTQSKAKRMAPKSDFRDYPKWQNDALTRLFLLEKYLLRVVSFPFGVSLMCVATKRGGPA